MNWDDPSLRVSSDTPWRAKRRILQSWWRQAELHAEPGTLTGKMQPVGSLLTAADVEAQPWLNFLNQEAFDHALLRAVEVQAAAGTLDKDRLLRNLLSSMPLCFNVFGALRSNDAFLWLLQRTWAPEAAEVLDVQCEWAPQPKQEHLADNTAFDAAVWFRDTANRSVLLGVEVKYTEPFSAKVYDTDRYRHVTDECGWFRPGARDVLRSSGTNQMWRNTMLAAAVELAGQVDRALIGTLSLGGDPGVAKAILPLTEQLTDQTRLRSVTVEDLTAVAAGHPELESWVSAFRRRYLDDPTGDAGPEPSGLAPLRQLP